ncbi:MAG: PKD domain-containing protein, partial [Bacteroidetes bacterium]|nr:PKD domain-containing protein [Bacteroidota bacterium]
MFSRIFIVPLFIISLWNLPLAGHTQGEFNKWYFGVNAGIDFNSTPPVGLSGSAMNTMYTSACVTDSLGNLLFYSQGLSVYNRNHQVMPNGNGLFGGQNTQGVFAVKKPGSENLYFLFTVYFNLMPLNYGLYYSLIDMNLNGGIGDVVSGFKNIPVAGGEDVINGIHGARHFNNKDAWIVVRKTTTNEYAAYRVTSSGISSTPVLSSCSVAGCGFYSCGYVEVKISQDGTRYVFVSNNPQQNMHVAEVGLFNCNTGVLTPLFQFRPVNPLNLAFVDPRNIEFSPDSKRLYVATTYYTAGTSRFVFQYDLSFLDSTQFMQSQLLISSTHEGQSLQLGSDGKIYQTSGNVDSLNVINNPNVHGLGCNFQTNAISLANGTFNHSGLPQFLQRYKAYIHSFGNCQNDSVHFSADIWPLADTTRWNFGDPASDAGNISTLTAPAHLYANPGTYMVTLYVRHNDNRTDTTWRTITIDPSPAPSLGTDRTICTGNTAIFDAGFCSGCTYEWKNVGSGLIVGTTQTFTTGTAGFYGVIVTNTNGCTGSDTVQLITTIIPAVNNDTLAKTICSGASTNIPLTGNVPEVMFHWTATLTAGTISGFSADSGLAINQTLINNGATAGVVSYQITPKIGDCAGANVDFPVTVNIGDPVDVSITASGNTVCAGTTVTFTATAVNPGTSPVYQWKVNSADSGLNSPIFTYVPANGEIVTCILTSSNTVCTSNNPATSNSITMVVNPLQPVSVTITPSANPVCAGTSVNFNAIPINGGAMHIYQWKVNGTNEGTNNPVFTF